MTFYELIRACEKAKTHAEIRRLLGHHKDNKDIKELFRLMLDKGILYNIKKVPQYTETNPIKTIDSDIKLMLCIQGLLTEDLRGDKLKRQVKEIHECCTNDLAQVFCWVLDRSNPAKVGKSFVNKIWPGLIRVQEYMGAVPGTQEALEKLPWDEGVAVQEKEDGMACLVKYEKGEPVELRTRQGQDITKYFPVYFSTLRHMPVSFNSNVHHELFVWDTEEEEMLDRKTGNGLISKQVKNGKIGGSVDTSLRSVLLDIYSDKPQADRYATLGLLVTASSWKVREVIMYSLQEARTYALNHILRGGEGVICKHRDKGFKQGKPTWNVKIKHEFEVELRVTGWKSHSKQSSQIGSLLCESEDSILEVNVGSGLSDFQRSVDPSFYLYEIVTVRAESVIKSKGKKKPSLYLPRFSDEMIVRLDKDKADTYKQIKAQEAASKEIQDGVPKN